MHHDPDRSWINNPDPDHSKGTHPRRQKSHVYGDVIVFEKLYFQHDNRVFSNFSGLKNVLKKPHFCDGLL